jgi:WXG100 family type VII secretion target
MAAVAANFDKKNESLQQILSTLMNKLSGLTTSWQGLGGQAFEGVKIQYATDLKKLNQALADTAEAIRLSGAGYASTDTDAASRVSSTSGNFQLPL